MKPDEPDVDGNGYCAHTFQVKSVVCAMLLTVIVYDDHLATSLSWKSWSPKD